MFVLDAISAYGKTDRTALINREERLSFAKLDARSDAFAAWLLERFGGDRTPVVIYGHKQTDILPCIYGALKSGRGYVPVDLVVPPQRAAEIAADVEPKVVVDFSGGSLETDAVTLDGKALGAILDSPPGEGGVSRDNWISGDDTAYILFTSGSTGKPKGVPITANNLTAFYEGLLPYMGEEGSVVLNQVSYSFDVSCCSIYAGISRGMTLFTVDKEMVEDIGVMFGYLRQSRLAMWVSTPSFAELCAGSKAFSRELLPEVGSFLFCGEVLTHKLCDTLAQRFPGAGILNTYGPTEATVLVTAVWVTRDMREAEPSIPIGGPISGVELCIVDERGVEIDGDGVCGELLILGKSVGTGYYRRPDLTEKSFFTDKITGRRGYRTGDLCYRRDGLYYYTGRMDNQLKLNGYRVELQDIEHNLERLENVARAAVLPVWADEERSRVQYLAAFLLLEREDGLTPLKRSALLKKQAAEVLPAYMIPRRLIAVDAFPLNTNGKIDKKALERRLEKAENR